MVHMELEGDYLQTVMYGKTTLGDLSGGASFLVRAGPTSPREADKSQSDCLTPGALCRSAH